ncbi:MAG: sugar-binding transcriptional regulator [Atribacterota bacterium]
MRKQAGDVLVIEREKNKYDKNQLMYQIARLYYEEERTQQQISDEMGISRQQVQRLLDNARSEGLVQIRVINPFGSFETIEKKLESRYHLKKAIVVGSPLDDENMVRKNIGRATARYLENILIDTNVVGLGWGYTLSEVLRYFDPDHKINITAVPLVGGVSNVPSEYQTNEMTRRFAEKAGGIAIPFYAPAIVDHEDIAKQLLSDNNLKIVTELWKKMNVAVLSMGKALFKGSLIPDFYHKNEYLFSALGVTQAVGEIAFHLLRQDGTLYNSYFSKRVVGISLEQLKQTNLVIGIAGCLWKKDIITAVLRGGHIHVLVTDEHVAREIVKE